MVSKQFEGKALLARHRLVNGALAGMMGDIHALSIKGAKTPAQAAALASAFADFGIGAGGFHQVALKGFSR